MFVHIFLRSFKVLGWNVWKSSVHVGVFVQISMHSKAYQSNPMD